MASVAINNTDWLMRLLSTQSKEVKDAVFQKLASIADVASLNKQERLAYDENLRKYRDTIAVMEGQYLEGLEKGMEKGQLSEKKETAMRLRDMGLTIDQIAQGAGITVEEATKLLDKKKKKKTTKYFIN